MSEPRIRPYGSWTSPITAAQIAAGAVGLSEIQLVGEDIYWLEMRPTEGGRSVVVRRTPDGNIADCMPQGFNARTRVHEYGGGSYLVGDDALFFANFADQRVYRTRHGEPPVAITPTGF
ncbi:MAG: S9 family peptidase, partial [Zetaproteobacteria bacterium]